ncbi:MAG: S8 family serine peptidase, partial [Anaerolineae bacterium]
MMKSQVQFLVNRILVSILVAMLVLAGASVVTAAPQSGAGEISGLVFFDRNGNGVRDAGEHGIAGVVVELRDATTNGQTLRRQVTTDAGGAYRFVGVPAGTYIVVRPEDALYVNTTAGQQIVTLSEWKSAAGDMRAPADGNARQPVDSPTRIAADFGASPAITLVGTYFDDRNGDGVKGLGERGIPGVQVRLYDDPKGLRRIEAGATELGSTTTDAQGNWIIRNVKPGKRVVAMRTADGAQERQVPLTLEASEVSATVSLDGAAAAASPCDDPGRPAYQTGEAIVGFRGGIAFDRAAALLGEYGASIKQVIADDTYLVTAAEEEMAALLSALASRPEVRYAERNGIACAGLTPTDPDYSNPYLVYAPQLLNAPAAWDYTTGYATVTVAVVDTGVSLSHPEFAGRILPGWDFVNSDSDPSDDNGHGTHVAGIIAAAMNNGLGTTGLAPNVSILPVKVLGAAKSGTWANVSLGIRYAADYGAKVINLSLGGTTPSTALLDAIRYAQSKGALVVAAAGNNGSSAPFYPAYYDEVVAVSATDEYDQYWTISNYGTWVDVAAPGSSIWSTYWTTSNPNGYGFMSGTSMAAPHVSGLAALIWSVNPTLSPAQVRDIIQSTAVDKGAAGFDPYYGWGR